MLMHFNRALLVILLAGTGLNTQIYAQQGGIPPEAATQESQPSTGGQTDRIVEGRPNLYGAKKGLHPFSWIEAGLRPAAQAAEKFAAGRLGPGSEDRPPKVSGVKFSIRGVGGGGSSSGLGPEVRPFHNDLFGTGT